MAATAKVKQVLDRFKKLEMAKAPWLNSWQLIAEYVMTKKQDFTSQPTEGSFLTGKIFDATAPMANHRMASSLIGALWPNGAKTFEIKPPLTMKKEAAGSEDVKKYYQEITKIMVDVIDNAKAGFIPALEEYMLDQGAFGISGIGVYDNEDREIPVRFVAVDAKKMCIDEGADGFIDTVYIKKTMTVRQLVQEYGIKNVSEQTRKAYEKGNRLDDKVDVLQVVEPRMDSNPNAIGSKNYPIAAIDIEMKQNHQLRESGYHSMPIFVTRFWKAAGEIYGRSPAFECMPDILEANALREASIIATEKMLDPPLSVPDDGSYGGGVIDTSAGAINIRKVSGRMEDSHKIEELVTVVEMNSTFKRIGELKVNIEEHFFIDRLTDLNNDSRMTLGEANIRNELRGQSLGTIYARQIAELFERAIERVFEILFNKGMLGVSQEEEANTLLDIETLIIPDAVQDLLDRNLDAYKINFISPAARIMRAEELAGILKVMQFVSEMAPVIPEVVDSVDIDEVVRLVVELTGAPASILKSADAIEEGRQARQQMQMQMQQAELQEQAAKTAKHFGQAAQASAKAGIYPYGLAA